MSAAARPTIAAAPARHARRHAKPRRGAVRERRLPGFFRNRPTQMFNGYADQVAHLYAGMDLRRWK